MGSAEFQSYSVSVNEALNGAAVFDRFDKNQTILLKPNLVNDSPFPVTTHPEFCEAVIIFLKNHTKNKIVIAEGCGDMNRETADVFHRLGYQKLAQKYNVTLIDLNYAPLIKLTNPNCQIFPEMYLPEIAFKSYIISLPVLKAHSLADITGALKNMMGFAPPKYYAQSTDSWKKGKFHQHMHQSIIDLNLYRYADLSIMDASVGLADYHLGGAICNPPVNKLIFGTKPWEVDREAAQCLDLDWHKIPHLSFSW